MSLSRGQEWSPKFGIVYRVGRVSHRGDRVRYRADAKNAARMLYPVHRYRHKNVPFISRRNWEFMFRSSIWT